MVRLLVVTVAVLPIVAADGDPVHALAPTPVFAPYINFPVGVGKSAAVADFTGDGRNDVVLTTEDDTSPNADNDHLWLFVQGTGGKFTRSDSLPLRLGWMPQGSVAAGDLDGDGGTDAVVATGHSLSLFLQRSGTLAPGRSIPLDGVAQVVAGDVDGDGRIDLVANGTGGIAVLKGADGGELTAPTVISPTGLIEVEVGDVTGDGRPDVVGCSLGGVEVLAQRTDGSFAAAAPYPSSVACDGLALGDLTGDGRLDVGIAGGGNRPSARVAVFAQVAGGTLAAPSTYATYDLPGPTDAGDMNGDGRTDLVLDHKNWQAVSVHAQAPDQSLDPRRLYTVPYANHPAPKAMDLGDVTGDGRNDVVIADDLHGLVVLVARQAGPSTTTSSSLLPTTTPTTAPPGAPPRLFDSGQQYDVNGHGASVATGDFNGDGRADVALLTEFNFDSANDYKLFLFLQGPGGPLERVIRFDTDVGGSDILSLAAGDLDGDRKTDVVLRSREGIDVFLQRNGTFADRKYLEMPFAYGVALADVDGDGKADLVTTGPAITVHRSLGNYTFAAPVTVAADRHTSALVQDVTGDGRMDIVTSNPFVARSAVEVFAQTEDGGFAAPVYHPTGADRIGAVTVGDLTGDGRPDLAVVENVGDYWYPEAVRVLPQAGDGSFGPPVAYPTDRAAQLRAADLNGDGRTDLLAARAWQDFRVRLQQPDGTLGPEEVTEVPLTGNGLGQLVVEDVSGDGRADVVVANPNVGLTVVRNTGATSGPTTTTSTTTTTTTSTTSTTSTTVPPSAATLQTPYSVWSHPGGTPLDGVGTWVAPANDPRAAAGQLQPAYLFGHLFNFTNSSAQGVVGLVTHPAGKFAVFSVVGPDGTPRSAAVPLRWQPQRFYFLFAAQIRPGEWGAWAFDHAAGTWMELGRLALPVGWGKLAPQSVTTALWFGPTGSRCSAYPRADVVFHPALGLVGSSWTTATLSASAANPGDCPPQISVESTVWARYRVGAETGA